MKKIILRLFVLMFIISLAITTHVSAQDEIPKFSAGQYNAEGELIIVKAKGMVCEFCAKSLEKVFMREKEVSGVTLDLTTKNIYISLNNDMTLSDERVEKLVVDAGNNVGSIKRVNTTHDK